MILPHMAQKNMSQVGSAVSAKSNHLSLYDQIFKICKEDNLEDLKPIIEQYGQNFFINETFRNSCRFNAIKIAKYLVEEKISDELNIRSGFLTAIQSKSYDLVEYISNSSAIKNKSQLFEKPALHLAVEVDNAKSAKYLLEKFKDYFLEQLDDNDLVKTVFEKNSIHCLRLFVENEEYAKKFNIGRTFEINRESFRASLPLGVAFSYGSWDIIHYLIVEKNIDKSSEINFVMQEDEEFRMFMNKMFDMRQLKKVIEATPKEKNNKLKI